MSTVIVPTFNPLQFANRLKAVGVPPEQAEAEAEVLREAFDQRDKALAALEHQFSTHTLLSKQEAEQMATKGDIATVRGEIAEVKRDIVRLEGRMILLQWMFGFMLAGVVLLVVKAFL